MLKNNLSKIMGEKRLKISEVARISGLCENTVRRVYYDTTSTVSYKTIEGLCFALDCTTQDIFEYIPN